MPDATRPSGTLWWLPTILACDLLDPTETLLLVGLADHIDADDSCFVGIDRLAAIARVSYATARRRLTALEQRGFIGRGRRRRTDGNLSVYDYTLHRAAFIPPALNVSGDQRSPGRAVTSAHQGERAEPPRGEKPRTDQPPAASLRSAAGADGQGSLDGVEPPAVDELKATARAVTLAVFERKSPKPATPFVAVQQIARRLIDAGHAASAVEAAMLAVPTITVKSCEVRLAGGWNGNSRPVHRIIGDEARGGESRVLTREEVLAEYEGR